MSRRILATLAGAATLIAAPSAAFANASVDGLQEFETVVPTAFVDDNPAGVGLMFAECDVQRAEKPDGSAVENYQCHETSLPIGITMAGPVGANGTLPGLRVPPFETQSPNEFPVRVATDTNGMTLGRRVATFDDKAPTEARVAQADEAAFGRHGGKP